MVMLLDLFQWCGEAKLTGHTGREEERTGFTGRSHYWAGYRMERLNKHIIEGQRIDGLVKVLQRALMDWSYWERILMDWS